MKKGIALLLTFTLLFSLAGCGLFDKKPAETSDPAGTPSGGGTQVQEFENKIALSIDKTKYDKEESIAVTMDFSDVDKDNAVIVIVNADMAHGELTPAEDKCEEHRWISDFSEIPFYMSAPNKDGLFDVRVYATGNGEELASVSFAVGNATVPQKTDKPAETAGQTPVKGNYDSYGLDTMAVKALKTFDELAPGVYAVEENILIKCENSDLIVPEENFIKAVCGTDYYQLNIGYASDEQLTDYAKIQYLRESYEMLSTKALMAASCIFKLEKKDGSYADFQAYLSEQGYTLMPWKEAANKNQTEMYEMKSLTRYEDKWLVDYLNLRFPSRSHKYAEGSIACCTVERRSDYTNRYVYPVESLSATLTPDVTFEQVKAVIDAMRANGAVDEPDKGVVIQDDYVVWHGRILVDTEIIDGQSFECYDHYKVAWMPGVASASLIRVEYYYGYIYV